MPPIAKHSPRKLIFYRMLAALEAPMRNRPVLAAGNLRSIRNFLFLQYDSPLGSVIHATPLLEAIKRTLPDAHISVAASSMAASILSQNPFVDRCVVTPDPWQDFFGAARAVRAMYQALPAGPTCLATTLGNQRSRLAFLAMHAASDAVRVGYMLAAPMYDLSLPVDDERSQIESNLDILRALGHAVAASEPRVFFQQQDAEYAAHLLQETGQPEEQTRIVYVTQNSGGQPNKWRKERFEQVIHTLASELNTHPVFVGTAREAAEIQALRDSLPEQGSMLAGRTTIPQLAAVCAQCDLVVSLDTGTFHVARAVGLPGVVIAPGWQNPMEWLPIGQAQYKVVWDGPTSENPSQMYLDEISPQQVIDAARELLRNTSLAARDARVKAALCDNVPTTTLL